MIHAIYTQTNPRNKWHLFSITLSAEKANQELQVAIQDAQRGGNEQGQAAIQTFDTTFFIPEMLDDIKEQKNFGFN